MQASAKGQGVLGDEPTATDPLGQPVLLVTGSPQAQGGSVAFASDPTWPTMTVNIEMAVPAAPPEADGSYQQAITFADVPLPDGPGQAITLTSGRDDGTRHPNHPGKDRIAAAAPDWGADHAAQAAQ